VPVWGLKDNEVWALASLRAFTLRREEEEKAAMLF